MSHSEGGISEGGAFAAAFICLIIVEDGVLYFLIGLVMKIAGFLKKQRNNSYKSSLESKVSHFYIVQCTLFLDDPMTCLHFPLTST
ncbi:hypothetical protein A8F95_11755 [Bacillus wudalianchiensis]|uniref:Uncharacterized protein n=1 Tax=Pseudobacillus wudalianchiensis TaxID=1743143 RepID=A0A1B9ANF0_9BACI|nr:hypothetical protein A8F95_11755 [Bacillus wudalianchiensis]